MNRWVKVWIDKNWQGEVNKDDSNMETVKIKKTDCKLSSFISSYWMRWLEDITKGTLLIFTFSSSDFISSLFCIEIVLGFAEWGRRCLVHTIPSVTAAELFTFQFSAENIWKNGRKWKLYKFRPHTHTTQIWLCHSFKPELATLEHHKFWFLFL